jgi:hypothetical protein
MKKRRKYSVIKQQNTDRYKKKLNEDIMTDGPADE